ncbi:hypothetical protein [Methylocella sp.]|uniref:hypothetical protein n=1 Tax=Methylocella sp. TaxID=1978226 RepID=UPI0035B40E92
MPPFVQLLRRAAVRLFEALVVFYLALDAVFTPLFRPLARWAARLRIVLRLQDAIAALPPYAILVALAVPFAVAEPAKLYALVLIADRRWLAGAIVMGAAYVVSLLVVERIYAAGRAKLRTIPWFARLMDWLVDLRDRLLAFARATRAYGIFMDAKRRLAPLAQRARLRLAEAGAGLRARGAALLRQARARLSS